MFFIWDFLKFRGPDVSHKILLKGRVILDFLQYNRMDAQIHGFMDSGSIPLLLQPIKSTCKFISVYPLIETGTPSLSSAQVWFSKTKTK